jgi:hypothetical protein
VFEKAQVFSCEAQRRRAAVEGASSRIFWVLPWRRRKAGRVCMVGLRKRERWKITGSIDREGTWRAVCSRGVVSIANAISATSFCESSGIQHRRRAAGRADGARTLSQHEI